MKVKRKETTKLGKEKVFVTYIMNERNFIFRATEIP